jgi:hypothetical protein
MIKKIVIGALATIGAIYLLLLLSLYSSSDCTHNLRSAASSPDNKFIARHVHTMCESSPSKIEVFLGPVENDRRYIIFSATTAEPQQIKLTWVKHNELLVQYPFSLKSEHRSNSSGNGGVFIKYEYFK